MFLGVAVYWLLDWFRRSESALYRAAGVRRAHLLAVRAWERLIVGASSFGTAIGCSLVLTNSPTSYNLASLVWADAAAVSLSILAVSIATTRTLSSKRLAELLKDR
ncbi:MAG: hypothetical protein GXP34_06475 [Actinobacteria bacterium]|nr:hypothetical protein [Actinomycetota bacterium]